MIHTFKAVGQPMLLDVGSGAVHAIDDGLPLDLCAVDLSAALDALGEITGETMNEAVISEVFSRFCVGK